MIENIDYELTLPAGDEDIWHVRILKGDYVETVFHFGALALSERDELKFNVEIVSTPDSDLTVDDIEFQQYCGKILQSVLSEAADRAITDNVQSEEEVIDESQY